MRTATLLFTLLLAAGCNGSDLASVGGPLNPDGPTAGGDPDGGINPDDPHNGDEEGEDYVPPVAPSTNDTDGDGIPNEDDNIPCAAFYVKIWNQEVSSAEVNLNNAMIVESSFFPTDEVIVEFINPVPGINYIDFGGKVAGSPEDELHTEIWNIATPTLPAGVWFHETIVRGNGQPEEVSGTFDINVTC